MSPEDAAALTATVVGAVVSFALLWRYLHRKPTRWKLWLIVMTVPVLAGSIVIQAEASTFDRAEKWRPHLVRAVQRQHGLHGPVALHAAVIHQESRWRPEAESPVGAQGLAQIMPSTADHLEDLTGLERFDSFDPRHAITGMTRYTRWIKDRLDAERDEAWAMTLSAYNGGLGWVYRDQRAAAAEGLDPGKWWCNVEAVQTRGAAAQRENRHYVKAIVVNWQEDYMSRGWPGPRVEHRAQRCEHD